MVVIPLRQPESSPEATAIEAEPNTVVDLIRKKRNGLVLSDNEINQLVAGIAAPCPDSVERMSDGQAAALAMAIYFRGLNRRELATWTRAMVASGHCLDLDAVGGPTVDKHSTGGVGDKLSLIVVPIVAACGAVVPQLSGRGLGHTGGTLDKMEAIPGWTTNLSVPAFLRQLRTVGAVIAGASADLAPADRRLYALRDVTATVESLPLIASSIMSKKIAEGTQALVLDVKVGGGAFMKNVDDAKDLAETMVRLGRDNGVATSALVTEMDHVLGLTVGNGLEVAEALEVLEGGGPPDVVELSTALSSEMLRLAGIDANPLDAVRSGRAREIFEEMVTAQGGSLSAGLPTAEYRRPVRATSAGYLVGYEALAVGRAAMALGAGRVRQGDPVSASAGIRCLAAPGERVEIGQPVLELHSDEFDRFAAAEQILADPLVLADSPAPPRPRVRTCVY